MNQGMFEALLTELRQINERLAVIEKILAQPPIETTLEVLEPATPKAAPKRSKAA